MKRVLAILLLFIFSAPLLIRVGVMGNWVINHEYIAKYLCVQKDKPNNKCNGKCHLAKSLQKVDEVEENGDKNAINIPHFEFQFFTQVEENTLGIIVSDNKFPYNNTINEIKTQFEPSILIPPPKFI
ncbi:MAG: hypothetical protein R2836_05360 [Chitinophagales bacterium]|nr:hypothetical protein [Chitinophagales bacterium]